MYNSLKKHNNQIYTGMKIGGSHKWIYNDGKWTETKTAPAIWTINFNSVKTRVNPAPFNSGANIGTKFHWYIIADQIATKLNKDSYMTQMKGIKYKFSHKRPQWRTFSYKYSDLRAESGVVLKILEDILNKLKNENLPKNDSITRFIFNKI